MEASLRPMLKLVSVAALLILSTAAMAQPSFSKSFSPSTIGPGSISTLTFTIDNSEGGPINTAAFTDVLPAGVTIADIPNVTISCAGGTVNAPAGGTTITLSNGQIGAGSICAISVNVTSSTPGMHNNTSNDFTSSAGNSGSATADLTVATDRPGFSKSFSPATINKGERSTLTFTIDNFVNANNANNLLFTDNLPPGMVVADPPNIINTCTFDSFTGGTVTAVPGSETISLGTSGGFDFAAVAAGSICSISVDVIGNATGQAENITGELTSNSGSNFNISSGKAGATLTVNTAKILLEKEFLTDPIAPGDEAELQFTITNLDRANTATDITFTDDLDATLTGLVATGLPQTVCNGGSISGTSLLSFTGGTLGSGESCTFTVSVQIPAGATPGQYANTTSAITGMINGTMETGNTASADLFVQPVPIFTKNFLSDPVTGGDLVELEFTIKNTSPTFSATDISFLDNISSFLSGTIYTSGFQSGVCGAGSGVTTLPSGGETFINFFGGNLPANGECTFTVTLQIPQDAPAGTYPSKTTDITATLDEQSVTGQPATDELTVIGAVELRKEFADDILQAGDTTMLEFTLTNTDPTYTATNITFTDDLNAALAGMTAMDLPMNDICGTSSQISGPSNLTFTGGALNPGDSCSFSVPVLIPIEAASGTYDNITSTVTADIGGLSTLGSAASDDIQVGGLLFSKAFIDDPVIAGEATTLRFTIENISSEDATNIFFTDNLSNALTGLSVVEPLPTAPCGVGSSLTGTSFLVFSGGAVPANSECSFDVTVKPPANAPNGEYLNVTSNLSTTINGNSFTGDPATDILTVNSEQLQLTKAFTDDPVAPGDPVTLEFTLKNLDQNNAASNIAFTDDLDAALSGLSLLSTLSNDCGGTVSGTDVLSFTNGSLAADDSCTISVSVQTPTTIPASSVNNTTSDVTGMIDSLAVTGTAASDELEFKTIEFSKSFDGPTTATDTLILTFTIENLLTTAQNNIKFNDDLSTVLPGLTAIGLPITDSCGLGSTLSGTSFLTFTGGSLEGNTSCTINVPLLVPDGTSPGTYTNTTSDLTINGLVESQAATADFTVEPAPAFAKAFIPDVIPKEGISTLIFTIDNSASTVAATNFILADNLPIGLMVASNPNISTTCTAGVVTAIPGSGTVAYTGGMVDAAAICSFQVDVTAATTGVFVNTTEDLTSSSGNSGTASDVLIVTEKPNAGDIITNPMITDFTIECPGNDLVDGSNNSAAFELDYSASDEIDPGTTYFEYAVLLANGSGEIVDYSASTSLDPDFANLPADTFKVYGLAYQTSTNSPVTVAAYLTAITGDGDANDIQQIINDDNDSSSGGSGNGSFDLDLNSEDTSGDPVAITITPNPTLNGIKVDDICQTDDVTIQLSGLTPASTFTLTFDVSGDNTLASTTTSISSDANGTGSFTIVGSNFDTASINNTTVTITMLENMATGCTTSFSNMNTATFSIFELAAANDPNIITCAADATSFDLTVYDDTINSDPTVTITWYDGQPSHSGSPIGNPTAIDLNTVENSLWAVVTTPDNCTTEVQATVTIFDLPSPGMPLLVNDDSPAGNNGDGLSWSTAFDDLQTALTLACNCSIRPEIWVAAGTYKPSIAQDFDGVDSVEAREVTFYIDKDLQIYGGFGGTENPSTFLLENRNFDANETVLSGDIGTTAEASDNAYHVVYLNGVSSAFVLDGFTITGGLADGSGYPNFVGGGIFNDGFTHAPSNPTLANLIITKNMAAVGGGMYNDGAFSGESSPIISNTTFRFNQVFEAGGAMYNDGFDGGLSSPVLTDCTFKSNFAGVVAGAVYNDGDAGESSPTFANCMFEDNEAFELGGAVYNDGFDGGQSKPTFDQVIFDNNMAGLAGGAMYNEGASGLSSPTVSNTHFINNSIDLIVSPISSSSDLGSSGSPICCSIPLAGGGAIYNSGYDGGVSSGTFSNCVFEDNESGDNGGAVYNDGSLNGESKPTFFNNSFVSNNASDGGAFYNDGTDNGNSSPSFINCEFIENGATVFEPNGNLGGAMYNDGDDGGIASPSIINTTFFGNIAIDEGGALFNDADDAGGTSQPIITNTIFWGNEDEIVNKGATPQISFSIIEGSNGSSNWGTSLGTDLGNNLDMDPLFIDAANGDLRVQQGSPAINAGDNSAIPPTVTIDLAGNDRIFESIIDRGAYESTCLMILTQPTDQTVCPGEEALFEIEAMESAGTTLKYQWQEFVNGMWIDIAGATETLYTISNVAPNDNGTTYRVVISEIPGGCTVNSNAVTLMVNNPIATINISEMSGEKDNDGIICSGDNLTLTASGGISYAWSTGATTAQITPNLSDTTHFAVTVTDALGCTAITTQTILVTPAISAFAGTDQLNVCDTSVMLNAVLPEGAMGDWRIISGSGGEFMDGTGDFEFPSENPRDTFTGQMGETYLLEWRVLADHCPASTDRITISFNPDTDGDTVQDCNDICPGGDDTIDMDAGGAGMPDDCDCAPNDLTDEFITVNNNNATNTAILGDTLYQGSFSINSAGTVATNSSVTFVAGVEITLEQGFHAEAGSDFQARIEPDCDDVLPLAVQPNTGNVFAKANSIPTQQLDLQLEPNPTNNVTRIRFNIPQTGRINLRVLSSTGQLILTAYDNARFRAGSHTQLFDARQLPPGLYYIQLETESERITQRLAVVK